MVDNRIVQLGGIWAENAVDPPLNPVAETTYADSGLTEEEIQTAWPYRVLVDGAKFNEFLRRTSMLIKLLEVSGVMPWSHLTTYVEGSHCLGSNGKLYRAIANAAANVNRNPVSSPAFWVCDNDTEAAARISGDFPTGTVMLFQQTAAPTGWTKRTTHDNKALRVVSGTAGTGGGSNGFTYTFAPGRGSSANSVSGSVGSTALTVAQLPPHDHPQHSSITSAYDNGTASSAAGAQQPRNATSEGHNFRWHTHLTGGGLGHNHTWSAPAHSHTVDMSVAFVDVILAVRD